MADNKQNNDVLGIAVKGDKSGLEKLRLDVIKEIAIMKAQYKSASDDFKTLAKVEVATIQASSKEKVAIIKQEGEIKKAEIKASSELEKQQKKESLQLAKVEKSEKEKLRKEEEAREKAWKKYLLDEEKKKNAEIKRLNKEAADQVKRDLEMQRKSSERLFAQNTAGKTKKGNGLMYYSELGENLSVIGASVGIILSKANQYLGEAISKSLEFERSLQSLKFTTDSITFEGLQTFNKEFKFESLFGTKDIVNAEAFLASQGRTEEQIKKTIKAAMDLSVVTRDDLDSAVRKLDMTYEGSLGRLGRLDGTLKDLTVSQLQNGDAVDIIGAKYEGLARNQASTLAGKIQIIEKNYNGLKKSLGDSVLAEFSKFLDVSNKSADDLGGTFKTLSDVIGGLVGSWGALIRVMPNWYSISKGVYDGVQGLRGAIRLFTDDTYSLGDAVVNLIDKMTDVLPLTRALKEIWGLVSGKGEESSDPVGFQKRMLTYVNTGKSFISKYGSNKEKDVVAYTRDGQPIYKERADLLSQQFGKDTDKSSRGTGRGDNTARNEKVDLNDIQQIEKQINDLKEKRLFYEKEYPGYLGIYRKYTEEIYKAEKELLDLKESRLKNVELTQDDIGDLTGFDKTAVFTVKEISEMDRIIDKSKELTNAHISQSATFREAWGNSISSVTGGLGTLFGAMTSGAKSTDAFKAFMKGIVGTFITSIQAMLLASNAAVLAKGITTFGISLLTDAPMLAAGWLALEAAKGFIGALEKGGDFNRSGYYLVGEAGPEIVKFNSPGRVYNNSETRSMLRPVANTNKVNNNVVVKVSGALRKLVKVAVDQENKRDVMLNY